MVDPEKARRLFDYLDTLPWRTSRLDWGRVPNVFVPFGEGDPQEQWVQEFSKIPVGCHEFIMVAYAPNQEALVGKTHEVLTDIDLLYAGAPGARYFCGADGGEESLCLAVRDFAEFSDEGVRAHLSADREG
ncbi:hypothetical protein [Streptomyces sp. AS02]|uniref:hypothetical protein n=1 Tax=Streptomyces sp. AS02 TaxID=2938946 RepID=UPI00201FF333|nr:hypothetical protein [Streptomyces sp. AS02]MCL8014598.1 hypothetical protein [Streptomyces sp. AS02]